MGVPQAAEPAVDELDEVIKKLAEKGLAEYLADADLARLVVNWLAEETGIRPVFLNLAIKALAAMVGVAAKEGGSWFGKVASERFKKILSTIPAYDRLVRALGSLLGRFDTEILAKREFKEILAGKRPAAGAEYDESLALELRGQLRLLQDNQDLARQMGDEFRKTVDALARIEGLLNPQPLLKLQRLSRGRAQRFTYRAQVAPFVGREQELAALKTFCDSDARFSWWLVVGPGGQGKSRLAFELCLSRANAWHAGFLREAKFEWDNWEPERPTLIVADYAARDVEELRKAAVVLRDRKDRLEFPVRLLLLERSAESPWFAKFVGSDTASYDLADCRRGEPLTLGPLGDDALWDVMLAFFSWSDANPPEKEKTLGKLKEIDEAARPLFASLVADALSSGGLQPDWSKDDLLTHVLTREDDQFWNPAGVDDRDRNLLCLVSMVHGIKVEHAFGLDAGGLLPSEDSFDPRRYQVMCGRPAENTLAPLEPDILGEFFVLKHLAPRHAADRRSDKLRILAWKASVIGMALFLVRSAGDFPENRTLRALLVVAKETAAQRLIWSSLSAGPLISAYSNEGQIDTARALYDDLAALARAYPDEPPIRERQALGARKLILAYSNEGQIDTARALYDDLAALARAYPDEPPIREQQALGARKLILAYSNEGQIDTVRALYDDLAALARAYPDEPPIREHQAAGLGALILAYEKAGQIDTARALYDDLAAFARAYPDEPPIRKIQAIGAFTLIACYYEKAGQIDTARALYDDLAALARAYPNEPPIREIQADTARALAK